MVAPNKIWGNHFFWHLLDKDPLITPSLNGRGEWEMAKRDIVKLLSRLP